MIGRRMAWAGLIALPLMATESPAQLGTEMKLTDAGFVMRIAKSPRQLERLENHSGPPVGGAHEDRRSSLSLCRSRRLPVRADRRRAGDALNYRDMVAPPPLPPGVKDFQGAPSDVGVNPEREIIHEMNADGEPPWEDDIFHPGF